MAAVHVIAADDIRRSGATTLPETLRLAPYLDVAQANSMMHQRPAAALRVTKQANI